MKNGKRPTQTGGRPATTGHIAGMYSLAVGMPPNAARKGWRWTLLTELARLESGHTPSRNHPEYWGGDIPWIGIRDATGNHGRTIQDTEQHTNELGIENSSARVLPTNTVCLSRTASVGYVVVMGRPMATSQDFVNWVCSDQLDFRFLKYVLLSEKRSLLQFASGTTHQTIYFPEVKGFHICHPDIDTQRKIAGLLSAYDDLIENNTRRIAILEEMAQAIYREWFVNFRFPGHEKVKLVNSAVGKIPEGWKVVRLKDISSKIGSGATPRGGKEAYKASGISLIRSLNVYDNQFEDKDLALIDDEQAAELDNVTVAKRDILLNITGASVARCCMVPSYRLPARVNQHVAIIRVNSECCDPFFVLNTINSERHKRQILALAQGGATREALTKDTISNYEIALPQKAVYTRYGEIVADLFDQREALQRKNNCLRTTRDLLLPKLISGQFDVEEIDIDAGESVLETVE